MVAESAYGARSVKPRHRRSNAELEVLDTAIITAVEIEAPVSLRGAGACEKTEAAYKAAMIGGPR